MSKQSDMGSSWSERYCILSTREFRYYYNQYDAQTSPEMYLGQISLEVIYKYIQLSEQDVGRKYSFMMGAGCWYKRNELNDKPREFIWACDTCEDFEDWLTNLEFTRTKCIYD